MPLPVACVIIAVTIPAYGQFFQEGATLVGTGSVPNRFFGSLNAAALSADGSTVALGYPGDNGSFGAVWVFVRSGAGWSQQGDKLLPNDAAGPFVYFGASPSLSSDGNTLLVGGPYDNLYGAAWVFTRSNGIWTQQGSKLVGTGGAGSDSAQGASVALSADGNTAIVGGPTDYIDVGATWVFTRSGSTWTQQGSKLVGIGGSGRQLQGSSVALSADGNTALIGALYDSSNTGATWVFTRSGSTWTQLGGKLVGTGPNGAPDPGLQSSSLALSGDGKTALIGGPGADGGIGGVWTFTLSDGVWSQQGNKLLASPYSDGSEEGTAVALSADGNTALFSDGPGHVWVFTRSDGDWTQVAMESQPGGLEYEFGVGLALSATGHVALVESGIPGYSPVAYVFAEPTLSISAPASAQPGKLFYITVTAVDSSGATVTGYTDSIHFTSTDSSATLPANATLTNGTAQFPVTLFTGGNQTITAADTVYPTIVGTSGVVNVPAPVPPTISKTFGMPTIPLNGYTSLGFTATNANSADPLTGIGFSDPFPAGLVVSNPSGVTGSCGGGTVAVIAGGGSVSLSGATLAPNSSCSFQVNVTATTPGIKNNITSAVTSNEAGSGSPASASLSVIAPPSVAVSFGGSGIPLNGVTSLSYTITNPAANGAPLTGLSLAGNFPPDMFVASPNGLISTCGGTAIAASGSAKVTLSGAILAAGDSCTFTGNITVTVASVYTSGLTSVQSANGGTGVGPSVLLYVLVPIAVNTVPPGLTIIVDGITYTGAQTLQLPADTTHTISVITPQPGTTGTRYIFSNWSDGGSLSHSISVFTPATYTATFTAQYQLTLAITPAGGGTITPLSGGFYDPGTSVNLTAAANAGYLFTGWTGAATPADSATATIVMSGPQHLTANFWPAGQAAPPIASVVNGASFQPGTAAPNTTLSLFSAHVSCTPAAQVLVNGSQAQVLFASDTQINFVVPASLGTAGDASLQVVCDGVNSTPLVFGLSAVNPAIFTLTQNGTGQGAILNQNYSVNSVQLPATMGSYVSVYVTGFGDLGAPGADGLQHLALPVTASIGGVPSPVTYAGEAPGFTSGLQQVNILVPNNAPVGSAVPIQLVVDGLNTQSGVTLAIQ
jgi:uncharacterized protein (TIGR03437 family)